ncbi:MAG: thymidine phosphorylase [Pseudomonadota bacterium]
MDARTIIARVRDRKGLVPDEARWFADGLASGAVTDAQAGAFAMAVLLNGLGQPGRVALTEAMRDSGRVLTWNLPGPVIDKHSTGGIGDSVSLLLAPALAACGAFVPMISGRGLGHTGGTLDKLEAIPGYRTSLPPEDLHRIVAATGCAIVGASPDIAPADRRLYGIRDISGTVESIDLITASILSKKLAAGLQALVLDVKAGSGAFMKTEEDAQALARALVDAAKGAGCPTVALLSDMDQPLGRNAGNAVEVRECAGILGGRLEGGALLRLTVALGGEALALAGLAASPVQGEARIAAVLGDGRAAEAFGRMVAALGGPKTFMETFDRDLPEAPVVREVAARRAGHVHAVDGEALGHAVVHLGGGRLRGDDRVDPRVGLTGMRRLGERLARGDPIARVHAATETEADAAEAAVRGAYTLRDDAFEAGPLVRGRIA